MPAISAPNDSQHAPHVPVHALLVSLLLNKAGMRRGSIAFFGHGPQQGESSSRTTRGGKIAIIFVYG